MYALRLEQFLASMVNTGRHQVKKCKFWFKGPTSRLLLSTMRDDYTVTDDKAKKPEMTIFYNQTKERV